MSIYKGIEKALDTLANKVGLDAFVGHDWQKAEQIARLLNIKIMNMPDLKASLQAYKDAYEKLTHRDKIAWDWYVVYESETAVAEVMDESEAWVDQSIEESFARFRAEMQRVKYEPLEVAR